MIAEKTKPVAEKTKPSIPKQILLDFLETKIKLSSVSNITNVKDHFLFEKNNVQRFRVNVWQTEIIPDMFCSKNFIGYSFFINYHKDEQMIIDKTIPQKPKKERIL